MGFSPWAQLPAPWAPPCSPSTLLRTGSAKRGGAQALSGSRPGPVCILGKREGQPREASSCRPWVRGGAYLLAGLHILVLIGAISVAYLGASWFSAKGRVCPFLQGVACSLGSARQCPGALPARGGVHVRPCNPPPGPRARLPLADKMHLVCPRALGSEHKVPSFTLPFSRPVCWPHVCLPMPAKRRVHTRPIWATCGRARHPGRRRKQR